MDDASLHADRIKLWDNFNHAWLALGQKQVDLMSSRPQQSRSQHLLSQETIEQLGNELVRLCDGLERHGLIDYQYGVWEDQIVAGKVFSPWVLRAQLSKSSFLIWLTFLLEQCSKNVWTCTKLTAGNDTFYVFGASRIREAFKKKPLTFMPGPRTRMKELRRAENARNL